MVREHEEFVWLHDRYVENEEYAGIIVSILPANINVKRNRYFINWFDNLSHCFCTVHFLSDM